MNATRLAQKRQEAEERNAKWQALSFEKQLEHLDNMFGKGKGATKQRAKIARQILERDTKQKHNTRKSK